MDKAAVSCAWSTGRGTEVAVTAARGQEVRVSTGPADNSVVHHSQQGCPE